MIESLAAQSVPKGIEATLWLMFVLYTFLPMVFNFRVHVPLNLCIDRVHHLRERSIVCFGTANKGAVFGVEKHDSKKHIKI